MKIIRKLLPPIVLELYRSLKNKSWRTYYLLHYRYSSYPRFKEVTVKILGKKIQVPDFASFIATYQEIFFERIYEFSTKNNNPLIIDVGANIGISVVFFKSIFPNAQIIALEPDKHIFNYLKRNIQSFNYNNIELLNKAAWTEDTELCFLPDGADGGKIVNSSEENTIRIDAINFNTLLDKYPKIDFLKMDIEGAEDCVFPACEKQLVKIDKIFIEYHSKSNGEQTLDKILGILKNNGFKYHIYSIFFTKRPFTETIINSGFDNQLNIYAWKI